MAENKTEKQPQAGGMLNGVLDELPVDRLKEELQHGLSALGERAVQSAGARITDLSGKLTEAAQNGGVLSKAAQGGLKEVTEGGSPAKGAVKGGLTGLKDKVKEKLGGGGGKGSKGPKVTNIIEQIDVGVPVRVAYNQWTQFQDFSNFMKKVDGVEQEDDNKVNFKAQVFWSHRRWEATIVEQVADEKIVWRSKGDKGYVDGAITFHEVAPNLTRILVVLEYHPQGFFERTGNLWRAQGRRARLELKHFRRHVMTQVLLDPESVEGWRGEIHEGEVTRTHEEALDEEQREREEDQYDEEEYEGEEEAPEDEYDEEEEAEEPEDEYEGEEEVEDEEPEDEGEEEEPEDEYAEEEPEEEEAADEEYEEEEAPEEEEAEEPTDEAEEEPEEEEEDRAPRRRRRRQRAAS